MPSGSLRAAPSASFAVSLTSRAPVHLCTSAHRNNANCAPFQYRAPCQTSSLLSVNATAAAGEVQRLLDWRRRITAVTNAVTRGIFSETSSAAGSNRWRRRPAVAAAACVIALSAAGCSGIEKAPAASAITVKSQSANPQAKTEKEVRTVYGGHWGEKVKANAKASPIGTRLDEYAFGKTLGTAESGRPSHHVVFAPRELDDLRIARAVPNGTISQTFLEDLQRSVFDRQLLHNPWGNWGCQLNAVMPL